jgi:hypothetical protein
MPPSGLPGGMGMLPPLNPGVIKQPPIIVSGGAENEEDYHRKYVFYLTFGTSNCNVCPGASQPKISINRNFTANDTSGINWTGSEGSMADGKGGSFYIGYRKNGEQKAIDPIMEVKMNKEERSCNSVFSSFFG